MRVSSEIGYHIGAPRCVHFTLIPCRAGTALASSGGIGPRDVPVGDGERTKKQAHRKSLGAARQAYDCLARATGWLLLVGCYYASEGLVQREFLALTGGESTKIPAVYPAIVHPVGVCMNQTFAAHRTGVADFDNLRFGGASRTGEEIGEAHTGTRRLREPVKVRRVIHQSTKPGVGGSPGCVYNGGL